MFDLLNKLCNTIIVNNNEEKESNYGYKRLSQS